MLLHLSVNTSMISKVGIGQNIGGFLTAHQHIRGHSEADVEA